MNDLSCNTTTTRRSRRQLTRGQSLVEFALMLPIIVMLLFLAGDFGRSLTAYIAISNAAREGAAYGMQSTTTATDQDGMRQAVLADTPTIWGVAPQITFPSCSDTFTGPNGTPYSCVAVTVTYQFQPLVPIGPIPDTISMQRTVRMRVIN